MINHDQKESHVMLVEIPDPEVILGIVIAFFAGLFALYVFMKINPLIKRETGLNPSHLERLEYYEKQLIDMKIRLDSLDVLGIEPDSNNKTGQIMEDFQKVSEQRKQQTVPEPTPKARTPNLPSGDVTSIILERITQKPMTSRDIQITLGRTREHTARLLKKIYQEGLIDRDTKTKPYRYFITEDGKAKLEVLKSTNSVTA